MRVWTNWSPRASSTRRSPSGPSNFVPSGSVPDGSIRVSPSSAVRQRPIASKFSSANPSGSIRAWQLEQTGLLRWSSMRSRTEAGFPLSPVSRSAGTSGGGGGGGAPRTFSSSHLPRSTGDVRVG